MSNTLARKQHAGEWNGMKEGRKTDLITFKRQAAAAKDKQVKIHCQVLRDFHLKVGVRMLQT